MKQDIQKEAKIENPKTDMFDGMRQMLAFTICEQNRNRSQFMPNLKFGDPIWDVTLSIYTAEYLGRSTTVESLSQQSGTPVSIVNRCIEYLLVKGTIFENRNQFGKQAKPYLISDKGKDAIGAWLDNCISELQTGLNEVASYPG